MADPLSGTMTWLSTGNNGIFVGLAAMTVFIVYLIATRKPRQKEFKPMDLKKETKKRYNEQFKFFGTSIGTDIYEPDTKKPFGYVMGYMRVVWIDRFKKWEPIHRAYSKDQFNDKMARTALEVYQLPYDQLNDVQKKNVHEIAKDELPRESERIERPDEKIVGGKRELIINVPVPCYMMRITKPKLLYKILAQLTGIGASWYLFDADQLEWTDKSIILNAHFPRTIFNNVFVFSKAGKQLVQDIAFGVERENVLQETANQIPRTIFFDTAAARAASDRRETAKIEQEKYRHQVEANE